MTWLMELPYLFKGGFSLRCNLMQDIVLVIRKQFGLGKNLEKWPYLSLLLFYRFLFISLPGLRPNLILIFLCVIFLMGIPTETHPSAYPRPSQETTTTPVPLLRFPIRARGYLYQHFLLPYYCFLHFHLLPETPQGEGSCVLAAFLRLVRGNIKEK